MTQNSSEYFRDLHIDIDTITTLPYLFRITGLESIDSEVLTSVEDIPLYPRDLQALIYPRGFIDSFPGPIRDSKNISSEQRWEIVVTNIDS
jgi:hypothetical protein